MLSPELFNLLNSKISGGVRKIIKEDQKAILYQSISAITNKPETIIVEKGEEYIVLCPFCTDRSGHLYINHRYNSQDTHTGSNNRHLIHCFRSDCLSNKDNRDSFEDNLFGFKNIGHRDKSTFSTPEFEVATKPKVLTRIKNPGILTPVNKLDKEHQARQYLVGRGFDINELANVFNISYCGIADIQNKQFEGYLICPIHMGGMLVGFQARFPKELDWKNVYVKRHLFPKGMSKSRMLYNFDNARNSNIIVICEGPSDVWAIGSCGIATLGKTISQQQLILISRNWGHKKIVLLVDGNDPTAIEVSYKNYRDILGTCNADAVRVVLPEGIDPGKCPRKELWQFITNQAALVDVDLSSYAEDFIQ